MSEQRMRAIFEHFLSTDLQQLYQELGGGGEETDLPPDVDTFNGLPIDPFLEGVEESE